MTPVSLINKHPFLFFYSEKGGGKQSLRRAAGPHKVRTSAGTERAHSSWVSSVFFPVQWFTCWGKLVWNMQTLPCFSWASKCVGDFHFCFSYFTSLTLETWWQCFLFQVEIFPTSFKCPRVEGLSYQRNTGHFKSYSYSLNFLVFLTRWLNYK